MLPGVIRVGLPASSRAAFTDLPCSGQITHYSDNAAKHVAFSGLPTIHSERTRGALRPVEALCVKVTKMRKSRRSSLEFTCRYKAV